MKTAEKALVSESALCADCGCPGIGKRIGRSHVLPTRRSRNSFRLSFLLRRDLNNGIMEEVWKDIEGYEGHYQVSNFGRVKSIKKSNRGRKFSHDGILAQSYCGVMRYPHVPLSKNGRHKNFSVHRLVAQAFIPNPMQFPIVNHIDENPQNNHVDNLEWCTQEYNCNHGRANKKRSISNYKHSPGYGKKVCALTKDGDLVGIYESAEEAKNILGLKASRSNGEPLLRCVRRYIYLCCEGRQKTSYGYQWCYKSDLEKRINKAG